MDRKLYFFSQGVLMLAALYWTYASTTEMDVFPWGTRHTREGGWYVLGIVLISGPLMLFGFLLKYWALRKMKGVVFYRLTPLLVFLGSVFIMLLNLTLLRMSGAACTLLIGLAMTVFFVLEVIWFAEGRTPWRDITSW